jgi:hypothetical protein
MRQADLEVGADLLEMLGGEVASVVGVECLWDAAQMPAGIRLAPDRLFCKLRQGCIHQGTQPHGRCLYDPVYVLRRP